MKYDPLPPDVEARLMDRHAHFCAVCVGPLKAIMVCERAGRGTRCVAICHGRRVVTVVPDTAVEDRERLWHFLHDEGEPYESPAAKRKRELQAEVDRLRGKL